MTEAILWQRLYHENNSSLIRTTIVSLIFISGITLSSIRWNPSVPFDLGALAPLYSVKDTRPFELEKLRLKKLIQLTLLRPRDEESYTHARNLAVYLFPGTLPLDDMERAASEKGWEFLLSIIEQNPHSPTARRAFDDLKAAITSYEGSDRDIRRISVEANAILELYHKLSYPMEEPSE